MQLMDLFQRQKEFSHSLRILEKKDWEFEDWALSQFTHKRRQKLLIDVFQEQIILKVYINTVGDKAAGSRRHQSSSCSSKLLWYCVEWDVGVTMVKNSLQWAKDPQW